MRKKLFGSVLMLAAALIAITTAAFAWFTPPQQAIENIIVTAGSIEVSARLYIASDFDLDGVLDTVGGEPVYTGITSLNLQDMKPGDVYSYRLDVCNDSDVDGQLEVYFDGADGKLSEVLSYASVIKEGEDTVAGGVTSRLLSEHTLLAAANLPPCEDSPQISIFFTITFERLEQLKLLDAERFGEKENLNEYQNLSFSVARIIVKLTQSID